MQSFPSLLVEGVKWSVVSACLLAQKAQAFQIQAVLLLWKPAISVFPARYILQALKILGFQLASIGTPILPDTWPRVDVQRVFVRQLFHYTACICDMTVCFYPHGRACIAIWHMQGYVLYRTVVDEIFLLSFSCSVSIAADSSHAKVYPVPKWGEVSTYSSQTDFKFSTLNVLSKRGVYAMYCNQCWHTWPSDIVPWPSSLRNTYLANRTCPAN